MNPKSNDVDVDLRLAGKMVSRCCFDSSFSLEVLEENSKVSIRIGGTMILDYNGTKLNLSGEKPTEAARASILIGKVIANATGLKDGTLVMEFKDGRHLTVPVDQHHEAWELSATDGFLVVSIPGGGLATWSPR